MASSSAQTLTGEWVRQADERIRQHRMAPIRIIVINGDGRPAAGAEVHIQQLRHDFTVGFAAPQGGLDGIAWDQPMWRCFNAVSLDTISGWPAVEPEADRWELDRVERVVEAATRRGMKVRWGGILSADAGRIPPWAAGLDGSALRQAAATHLERVIDRFGVRVGQFDIYTHALDHELLGRPTVRRLYEQAKARAPEATVCVRFEDTLTQARVQAMIARIMDMRQAMIPFDAISLEQRIGGILLQAPLARVFEVIGGLQLPVVVSSIEIGGSSEAAAAVNLETFLRTAFADPGVVGVYFAGVAAGGLVNPHAALIGPAGDATKPGQMLDDLFHKLWWTDETARTDELGNVFARIFAGSHRISATLSDGSTLETSVYIAPPAREQETRVVILEADAPSDAD